MPSSEVSYSRTRRRRRRRNKPQKALTPHAANGKVFMVGLKVPSAFRTASSHSEEGMTPEISPLSQIQLLICSPVNRHLRQSDPCLDLSSSSPHLTRTLQMANSASRKALILRLTFPALLPGHWDSAPDTSSLPTTATKPSVPFPHRTLLLPAWSTQASMAIPTSPLEDQFEQVFPNLYRAV